MMRAFAIGVAGLMAACAADAPRDDPVPPGTPVQRPDLAERPTPSLRAPDVGPAAPRASEAGAVGRGVRGQRPLAPPVMQPRDSGIIYNPFTRLVEGGDEHSFTTGRWQFVDRPQGDRARDGAAFRLDQLHYVNFDARRVMWGQDGQVAFRRLYSFDESAKTVTFTLDRSRCGDRCTDVGTELGSAWREVPTRFLGTYGYTAEGGSHGVHDPENPILVLTRGDEVIRLEAYREPHDLPALPPDQALCEVRDAAGDTVPGDPQFTANAFGQQLTGPASAFLFDHASPLDPTLYVEFLGAAPVRYDAPGVSQIIRRVTAYPTLLVLGLDGAHCQPAGRYRDSGRVWYDFPVRTPEGDPQFGETEAARLEFTGGTCFAATRENGESIYPVFIAWQAPKADDFGTFIAQGGERRRFGDDVRLRVGRLLSAGEGQPGDEYLNTCGWPMRWVAAEKGRDGP